MFRLHAANPEVWDSATLASVFLIREQRALAIVKLKEREFAQADASTAALNRLQVRALHAPPCGGTLVLAEGVMIHHWRTEPA